MTKNIPFKLDTFEYKQIGFEEFCDRLFDLLQSMRESNNSVMINLVDRIECSTAPYDLALQNLTEEHVLEFLMRYSLALDNIVMDFSNNTILPEGTVEMDNTIENVDGNKRNHHKVSIIKKMDNDLLEIRDRLLAYQNPDNEVYFWQLQPAQDIACDNIPEEFLTVAYRMRISFDSIKESNI